MGFDINRLASQEGRIAIVTGANNGVGYETTAALARLRFTVIMACRSLARAEQAEERLLERVPGAVLDLIELDLSRWASVRAFAETFKERYGRLDLLINNAGVLDYSGRKNEEGLELQLATNHLGHFLLTSLLIDVMPDEPSCRVVSLSSVAHKEGTIDFDDLNRERQPDAESAYAQSKLACLMFSDELQRRLERAGRKTLSVCAHPGGTDSGLFGDASKVRYLAFKLIAPFITHSNEDAAKPSLHAALADGVRGGEYFGPQGFKDLKGPPGLATRTEYSRDEEVAARLWEVSERLVGERFKL